MRKVHGLLFIVILFASLIVPVFAQVEVGGHFRDPEIPYPVELVDSNGFYGVKGGVTTEYYKGSDGYDRIVRPDGSVLVESQSYSVEYLNGKNWKRIGTPFEVVIEQFGDEVRVTRRFTDYDGTEIDVIYHEVPGMPTKTDVVINSGADRVYRVVWNLDGINNDLVSYGVNFVNFTGVNDWVAADWSDAFNQFGDISNYTVSTKANGKKLEVIFNVGLVKLGESLVLDPAIVDSYSETNQDSEVSLSTDHPSVVAARISAVGQSFTNVINQTLVQAKFYIKKQGSPTGNAVAVLYAHTGTYGTNSLPTGSPLATSDNFDISTLTTGFQLITFTFSGAQKYSMVAATKYVIVLQNPASGITFGSDVVKAGVDNSAPSASGNQAQFADSSWVTAPQDLCFYVLADATIVNEQIESDAEFTRNTAGWVNITVSDTALVADLTTVDIQVNTTGDVETFTFRWTQSGDTFSEVSDISDIVTLDIAGSVRTNINTTYDKISFLFTFTGGTDGAVDVKATSIGDGGQSDVDVYPSQFIYSTYVWTRLYWLFNSAADIFGVSGIVDFFITYLTAIYTYLTSAFTDMITLITQIFRMVNGAFSFTLEWLTRVITLILNISNTVQGIIDATGTVNTGLGNLWDVINFGDWGYDFMPIAIVISWFGSLDTRGKVQGWNTVLMGDLSTVINILSFMFSMFSFIINTAISFTFQFVNLIADNALT